MGMVFGEGVESTEALQQHVGLGADSDTSRTSSFCTVFSASPETDLLRY
jgi:hypothetical protein